MLVVETIRKIRRNHLVPGKSIRAIARERGVSRNTVRTVLRSQEAALLGRGRRAGRYPRPSGDHVAGEACVKELAYPRMAFLGWRLTDARPRGNHPGRSRVVLCNPVEVVEVFAEMRFRACL